MTAQLWAGRRHARHAELYEAEYAKQVERIERIRSTVEAGLPVAPPSMARERWDQPPDGLSPAPAERRALPAASGPPSRLGGRDDESAAAPSATPAAHPPHGAPAPAAPPAHVPATAPPEPATPAAHAPRGDLAPAAGRWLRPEHAAAAHTEAPPTPAGAVTAAAPRAGWGARWLQALAAVIAAGLAGFFLMRLQDAPEPPTTRLPGQATGLAIAGGRLWAAVPETGAVWPLDIRDGRSAGTPLAAGGTPARIAVAGRTLWAADTERAAVVRVPGGATLAGGADIADLVYAAGAVWTASAAEGTVRAIDPASGRTRLLPGGSRPLALAANGERVVAADAGGTLVAFDARARRPAGPPIALGGMPVAVALGGDTAWVVDAAAGTVRRVDLARRRAEAAPIPVGPRPSAVALAGRDLYVLCRGDRTLVRVDAARGRVVSRVRVLPDPTAMAVGPRSVWVAGGGNEVMRVDR